ncbi:MAG TPA: cupin domain-containing protein [Allosphingosinicella sp.]|nr:cupin domain-containing protein [Allosphingosinicella sp.]
MADIRICNLDDLDFERWNKGYPPDQQPPAERYGADKAALGQALGARKLGYNVARIDPGKAAYPPHNHRVNEEMFLILDGEGELRIGDARRAVRKGDIFACPPGGPETAHQLRNTGTAPLKVLMVSTMLDTDIIEYPDSDKVAYGVQAPGPDGKPALFRGLARRSDQPNYWEGE